MFICEGLLYLVKNKGEKVKNNEMINKLFVKSLESSYATLYIENMKLNPNVKNIKLLLKKHPLESCYF